MATEAPSGVEKVAILLTTLGPEAAAAVLRQLSEVEVRQVSQAIARLRSIPKEEAAAVHEEFYSRLCNREGFYVDGERVARTLISKIGHLSEEEEETRGILGDPVMARANFIAAVERLPPSALARRIREEHPQIIAFTIANLPPRDAAETLVALPEELQADVIARVADLGAVAPTFYGEVGEVLMSEGRSSTQALGRSIGGAKVAADLMNSVSKENEGRIFEALEEANPGLAEKIRDLMFTFEDIVKLDNREVQGLLKEVPREDLILGMKTASEGLRTKIFANVSSRAADILKEDMAAMGPVKLKDVERAQANIVAEIRRLEGEGKVTLGRGGGDVII
jgi:flagellar motor switch protein FliG